MMRDFKFLRRNSGKEEEIENVPVNSRDSVIFQASTDSPFRAPLNTIQDPTKIPRKEPEAGFRAKIERTPTKARMKNPEYALPLRTPEGFGTRISSKYRLAQKNESSSNSNESRDEVASSQVGRGLISVTPRTTRAMGRATPSYNESNSTHSTPTKSIIKPPSSIRSKIDDNGSLRAGNFAALYKGVPSSCGPATIINTVEVPHFDLKEDPSFWMDHNVQVLIRVRPLNGMEKSMNGYNRCLKQESSQSITWVGHPETRFTFDHVACETADQDMLFRMAGLPMVENCLSGYNSCMFAYGQTGSGKTHTMLGDLEDLEVKPSQDRGMTPRIFEFLFARIQAEEESRVDEKLKYNCKCSFLEIYNETITDLLDPTSTNLLVREDVLKGVYVENLSEYEVRSVRDILRLLTQGSLNRRVAATNMNRESSRSHSVFTCVIESRWEKDSTTNLRFARLNLVDLAGSERQKSSGAEGERLKEAANINKSLSTLGHVIMILLDVAHGKPKHVPYRDSRLTFLLQDSLGGNSKTMIIANVSPSICCAAETLNTLKFAQRAKLIQNNAVVNEDSTGDVIALRHQIRLLKEELSVLKRQNVSRSLSFGSEKIDSENTDDMEQQKADSLLGYECKNTVRISPKQLKSLETTLAGALRREQMAESSNKKLGAEIEHLNLLVCQREEDARSTKMMLKFREDKIRRMESLLGNSLSADSFLQEENKMLLEEIQLLQAKVHKNPEVTRFASENIRLTDQLKRSQEFYGEGERELLLAEVSNLRDQLLQFLDGNQDKGNNPNFSVQEQEASCTSKENDSLQKEMANTILELEECKRKLRSCLEDNAKLSREIHDLHSTLNGSKSTPLAHDDNVKPMKDALGSQAKNLEGVQFYDEQIMEMQLELDILKIMLKEENLARREIEDREICLNSDLELSRAKLLLLSQQGEDANGKLKESYSVIEALESQQIISINKIEDLRKKNNHSLNLLRKQELDIIALKGKLSSQEPRIRSSEDCCDNQESPIQSKFKRMQDSLDKAKRLNMLFQSDLTFQASNEEDMDETRRQAEAATAEAIVSMQEELAILQNEVEDCHLREMETKREEVLLKVELNELQEKLALMTEDNKQLLKTMEEKDEKLKTSFEEWELLAGEIEEALVKGHEALADASDEVDLVSSSFPHKRIWISEQIGRLTRVISEKELLIQEFELCLGDAHSKQRDLECMMKSLREAALLFNEAHHQECNEKQTEIDLLELQLSAKTSIVSKLQDKLKGAESHVSKASVCATVAFVIVSRLSDVNAACVAALKCKDIQNIELTDEVQRKDVRISSQAAAMEEANSQIICLRNKISELEEACDELGKKLSEEEQHTSTMKQKLESIEENDILRAQEKLFELKAGVSSLRSCMSMTTDHDEKFDDIKEKVSSPVAFSDNKQSNEKNFGILGINLVEELGTNTSDCFTKEETSSCKTTYNKHLEPKISVKDVFDRDTTIILLKSEIESALESLRQVQVQTAKQCQENEEMRKSERQTKECVKFLKDQVLNLHADMQKFEEQSQLKIQVASDKILELERTVQEAGIQFIQTKEFVELQVCDAKLIAAQRAAEATSIHAKFEEAQDTIKEADIMINEFMIANETMKLKVERLKKREITLVNERDALINQVQGLQSNKDLMVQQFDILEKQYKSNLVETRDLVSEVENLIIQLQATSNEKFMTIAYESRCMKSSILESTSLTRTHLEDIWSEIIMKDCAVSVLHLCHMGILLETVTGLNAENGLLQHGLNESNTTIADLREHNLKSRRELEMCRNLKGKLLADIKNSFDRIARKEEETSELDIKLSTFEKKISDLHLQEELMLQRSNNMGSQLAILMKELDMSNNFFTASLYDQERLMRDNEEITNTQLEHLLVNLFTKDIESLLLNAKLGEMYIYEAARDTELFTYGALIENLKKELIFSKVNEGLKDQYLIEREVEIALLEEKESEGRSEIQHLLSRLNRSSISVEHLNEVIKSLEQDIHSLKDASSSNDILKLELREIKEIKEDLLYQVRELQSDREKLLKDLKIKETESEFYAGRISTLELEIEKLRKDISSMENLSCKLEKELDVKAAEVSRMCHLEEEKNFLISEVQKLTAENCLIQHDLEEKKSNYESSLHTIDSSHIENQTLHGKIYSLESCIASLQKDVEIKNVELGGLEHSCSDLMLDLSSKTQDLQIYVDNVNAWKDEKSLLKKELQLLKKEKNEALTLWSAYIGKCADPTKSIEKMLDRLSSILNEEGTMIENKISKLIYENVDKMSKFMEEVGCLELHAKELISENMTLQGELSRKDDVLDGLLFDLRLLQESASNSIDQKDEIEDLVACLNSLEEKLAKKSGDLENAVAHSQMLETQLQEKIDMITTLELNILEEAESVKSLTGENQELGAKVEDALAEKTSLEEEVVEKMKTIENLELEVSEMADALHQMNNTILSLRGNLNELHCERDHFEEEILSLKEKLDKKEAQAKDIEAIALEAQELAESRRIYAEEREAEVKLLERSVEELECTVNVLENKVDIVKGEAERQKLQREELELEFHTVNQQMQDVKSTDADMKRHLDKKEKDLRRALQSIELLEKNIADKDQEIIQFKAHISELNLLAEAQASEYKQKFKELEAMAEHVRPEAHVFHAPNSSSNKSERNAVKSRGSGSPFKCIGLGLGQQIKSENDEDRFAAKLRIEELESLAASRQKEIYALKARLATAESMTHDVIRDLVGVKLDMTNYVSLLDNQQVLKLTEKAKLNNSVSQVKEDQEVTMLKQKLDEFIVEKQGWLGEIDRKQAEMLAAQIEVEKYRQRDQLLKAENDMMKKENVNHKKKLSELEGEVKKLSGQQNLQQRIHHHAKIKEENNALRIQNEDLSVKLQRAEVVLSGVKEELSHYRASVGKRLSVNSDDKQQLNNKMKADGVTKPVSYISPDVVAEEALEQLRHKLATLKARTAKSEFEGQSRH